jgi:hypothetical protein
VQRTARVVQLEGYFDLPPSKQQQLQWDVDIACDDRPWSIGLIVGPSGSGKSTIARELFPDRVISGFDWPPDRSLVDGFPPRLSIKAITGLLSSVGFSSPPSWLRPFRVLSTGEQFRVTIARALAEAGTGLTVIDEFTSVVDRQVAQVASAAVAKAVRRAEQQLVAVTCHADVEAWLQPDWIYQPHLADFQWRELQRRPPIALRLSRVGPAGWARFRDHHYLSANLNPTARCFVTLFGDQPVGFTAVLPFVGFKGRWREHRTVCLPEFQGVGIGMAQSALVASVVVAATGGSYYSVTSHPAFIAARARSPLWQMTRAQAFVAGQHRVVAAGQVGRLKTRNAPRKTAEHRLTASFRYVGPPMADARQARALLEERFVTTTKVSTTTEAASRSRAG